MKGISFETRWNFTQKRGKSKFYQYFRFFTLLSHILIINSNDLIVIYSNYQIEEEKPKNTLKKLIYLIQSRVASHAS